jgi:hypothetical protein
MNDGKKCLKNLSVDLKKKEKFLFSEKFYILCDNCFDWSLLIKKKSSNGQKMFFFILWQFSFLTQTHELFSNHFQLELIGGRTFKNFILRKISWSVGQIFFFTSNSTFFSTRIFVGIIPKKLRIFDYLMVNDVKVAILCAMYLKPGTGPSQSDFLCYRLDHVGPIKERGCHFSHHSPNTKFGIVWLFLLIPFLELCNSSFARARA